nr:DUF2935 domain-containing protein [Paenibacillus humicola]
MTDAQAALFEHRFWLQILGDHARFIRDALAPKETGDIRTASELVQTFDSLLAESRSPEAESRLAELNLAAYQAATDLRNFKLNLLERMLLGKVTIGLTPTFVNHMVNELEEYCRILHALLAGQPVPQFSPLHYDLLWLQDAFGHAGAIHMDLDRVERMLLEKSRHFEKHFQALYLKAVEMAGYMRTQLADYPAFRRFHADIDLEMNLFRKFLAELLEMELGAEVLDRISPLMPDHMGREECYYLTKLARLGLVPSPGCDPAKPRVE